jgi:hypothetical protein
MWVANESIDDTSGALQEILLETTLVDIFSQAAADPGQVATYSRDRKSKDILTSQALVPYALRVGYLPFYKSNHTNQRWIFLEI